MNQHMYGVEGEVPVLLHFNARTEPNGAVEPLVLEKAVPTASPSAE